MFLTSLKQTCNEYLIKFSENQSAPKLENRKTSPCSPCALNLLHVLVSRILGYHNLCSPDHDHVTKSIQISFKPIPRFLPPMFVIFSCSCQTLVEEPNCRYFRITLLSSTLKLMTTIIVCLMSPNHHQHQQ